MEGGIIMKRMNGRCLGIALLLTSVGSVSTRAQAPSQQWPQILREGKLRGKSHVTERVQIPVGVKGVQVRLEIEKPSSLDLDLIVYGTDPDKKASRPLCISDGTGPEENCALRRPESGELWARVEAVRGEKETPYRLTLTALEEFKLDLANAKPIAVGELPTPLTDKGGDFRVTVIEGEVAVVIYKGTQKAQVKDEWGKEYPGLNSRWNEIHFILGEPYRKSSLIKEGVREAKSFLVQIPPGLTGEPRGWKERTEVFVVGDREHNELPYVVGFTAQQIYGEDVETKGSVWESKKIDLGPNDVIAFRVGARFERLTATIDDSDLNVALCDKYGRLVAVGESEVTIRPVLGPYRDSANQKAVSPGSEDDELYLVVFASPFKEVRDSNQFRLVVKPSFGGSAIK